ncbi:hypothetical protein [Mesorhizobium sp. NZP2077]|uniref:hypothetical protein n=1 Tax=Mesorhizobium sp. NZP2077 TaxID=2483404 RepID=UPI001556E32D|nr:hypothetical protein [Mesorhizobium sp. NZP2077]QKC85748.1 hypothetical protein EB232_33190 [Mesorhizobium sp. NZP2077]QKD19388.1 hypothetical protein HGP13_32850 [Mesorhizobium sp. NZP2077]
MKRKPILLFVFPAFVLALLTGARIATFLLGAYPASPTMWWIWLELRPLSITFWQQVDLYAGGSMVLDAVILLAAAIVCWNACRVRRSAAFFLTNHVALLFAGLMIASSSHSETASTIAALPAPSGLSFSLMVDFTWENSLVLILGFAACAYCHVAFLREARLHGETLAVRLIALRRDF